MWRLVFLTAIAAILLLATSADAGNQPETTGCGGDPNAEQGCGNCGRSCSDYMNPNPICPKKPCLITDCQCKPDYVFDDNIGKCVLKKDCTKTCKTNEEFSNCSNGLGRVQDCKDKGKTRPVPPMVPGSCIPDCVCKVGFLRNTKGECVPEDQCETTVCRGENEVYSNCTNGGCAAKLCSELGYKRTCVDYNSDSCVKGCTCIDGYMRDDNGKCIPSNQCPSCGGDKNAQQGCGNCGRSCSDYMNPRPICPLRPCFINDCQCKPDFVYDYNVGKCVLKKDCTPICKSDEVFSNCTNSGDARSCADLLRYPPDVASCPDECKKGCVCKTGYLRADNGTCISSDQCPPRPDECPNDGSDEGSDEGSDDCPDDQEYNKCPGSSCFPLNCEEVGMPLPNCGSNTTCGDPACVCKDGKVFDEDYNCIDPKKCPSCGGDENAEIGCGTNCGKRCSDLVIKNPICILICRINGCDCKDKFYYDSNKKKCVPADECTSICPNPNEEYVKCPDCSPQTCNTRDEIFHCPMIPANQSECKAACRCKKGFYRNSQNICVAASECECPVGEEYSSCPDASCGPLTCSEAGFEKKNCGTSDPCPGHPGCICKNGYVRDNNGKCIDPNNCPSCGGDVNAIPGCSNYCLGRTCADIGKNTTGRFCPLYCKVNGCACKPDYYYDGNIGKCVESSKCTKICKTNEEFSNCSNGLGRVQDCKDKGKTRPVPPMVPGSCIPDCVCKVGFLRNAKGECVPEDQCEITCTNANEEYVQCPDCSPQTCATRNNKYFCPLIPSNQTDCKGACRCKKGHFRNSKKICVPADECEPVCDDGEIYSDCPPECCDAEYCPKNRNAPQSCPSPKKCPKKGRCVCGFNSHRDRKSGKCIPTRKCPPFACKKPNEVYDSCPPVCPGQNCSDYLNNATCPKYRIGIVVPCKPACRCKPGYYRNDKGDCVSGQQCKDEQNGSNCGGSTTPDNPSQPTYTCTDAATQEQLLQDGSNGFTLKFLNEQVKNNPDSSVFSAPSSIMSLLGILAEYSIGPTFTEIEDNVLNVKTKDKIRCAFPGFLKSFQAANGTELDLANSIYIADQYKLSTSLKSDADNVFNARVQSINFNQADQAAATINKDVSDATKGKITQLISPDSLNSLTRLVLTSAIYFKGTWKTEFNPSYTQESDFYVSEDKTSKVQMMYQKNKFRYSNDNDLDAQVAEIPYQDPNTSFIIILPNKRNGFLDVLKKLQDPAISTTFLNKLTTQTVKLYLPKFEFSTTTNLVDVLKSIGVKTIFTAKAELQGMIVPDESLYVSDAIHKAYCDVNEKGTTAAAASGVVVSTRAAVIEPLEYEVRADHSFIFCIKKGNLHLFIGRYDG